MCTRSVVFTFGFLNQFRLVFLLYLYLAGMFLLYNFVSFILHFIFAAAVYLAICPTAAVW